jgi:hypothetical protein
MTYILSTAANNTAIDIESLTILTNSSTDISISAGTVVVACWLLLSVKMCFKCVYKFKQFANKHDELSVL